MLLLFLAVLPVRWARRARKVFQHILMVVKKGRKKKKIGKKGCGKLEECHI